jgi:hypothetical protein
MGESIPKGEHNHIACSLAAQALPGHTMNWYFALPSEVY